MQALQLPEKPRALIDRVSRINEIRTLAAEADAHFDRYAETGCLAALGDAHRVDAQIERLLGEGPSA